MKKLLLLALLVSGCSMNTISNASSFLLDIFFISDKCNDLIHKYNNLQDEKKNMVQEYEMMKKNDTISYEQKQDLEDRILDLSFQIDDVYQRWVKCNGGVTTNITP